LCAILLKVQDILLFTGFGVLLWGSMMLLEAVWRCDLQKRMTPFVLAVCAAAWLQDGQMASAYSITSVQIEPEAPLKASDDVFLKVELATPGSPALLYKATDVIIDRDEVVVIFYPDSGPLDAIGHLTANVPLNRLRVGEYRYVIVLNPAPPGADWGRKFLTGTITLLPELELHMGPAGLFLRWSVAADHFVVEYADFTTPPITWKRLSYERERVGSLFRVRIEPSEQARFYRLAEAADEE
jgi:hypothetical protein